MASVPFRFPFVLTTPLQDLVLVIVLLPLWWVLGVEQWFPPLVLGWAIVKMLVMRRRLVVSAATMLMLCLLLSMLASSAFIVEPERWLSFVRNYGVHVTALFAWLVVTNEARTLGHVRTVLLALACAMAAAGVLGAFGFLGIARPEFTSPFGALLPDWLRATDYGSVVAVRSIGSMSWFSLLQQYFRTNSLFLFSTMYAAALAVTIPFVMYLATTSATRARVLWSLLIVVLLANLVHTTGRAAIVGFALGGCLFLLGRFRVRGRVLVAGALAVAATAVLVVTGPETIGSTVEEIAFARGDGSVRARTLIYTETIRGALERPLLGWGSERDIDVAGFRYPAGSHSLYLGMLFRHGLLGVFLLFALYAAVWWGTRPRRRQTEPNESITLLAAYGQWSFTSLLIIGLTTSPDVDMTLYLFIWTGLACVYAAQRGHASDDARRLEPNDA